MQLIRTEQIQIDGTDELSVLCHLAKNLWNESLYPMRQAYFHNKHHPEEPKEKIPGYNVLAGMMKTSENFKGLNAQSAQQLIKVLDRSWIIRKAIPDAFAKGIEGVGLHPIRSDAL